LPQLFQTLHHLWPCGRQDFAPAVGAFDNKLATNYPVIIKINISYLVTKLCAVRTYFQTDHLNLAQYFVYKIIE
jgi:hypothetical protein